MPHNTIEPSYTRGSDVDVHDDAFGPDVSSRSRVSVLWSTVIPGLTLLVGAYHMLAIWRDGRAFQAEGKAGTGEG